MMRGAVIVLALTIGVTSAQDRAVFAQAQEPSKEPATNAQTKPSEAKPSAEAAPKEESSVTEHTIRIGGQTIPYKAIASTTLLKNDKDEPIALMYSTAYVRSDVTDPLERPIAFIYNGGPGSASLWLHMGAFGPRRVVTKNAEPTGPGPYQIVDNPDCLLDKTDMVFIDPVGTGFSHVVGKGENKDFWGVDEDVRSLAQFIQIYISRNARWNSPKFLIGESYGTFRSVALGNYLQGHNGIYINGIVLISSVLDLSTLEFNIGDDRSYIFYLPSYAATAWYYKTLKNRPDDLDGFLKQARDFAANEYASALMKGSNITDAEKTSIANKLSDFTGISADYFLKADLRVTLAQFEAELQRSRGLVVGRYDSRYSGPVQDLIAEEAAYDPSYSAVRGAFTAAINAYLRQELKFSPETSYGVLSGDVNEHWDWKHDSTPNSFPGAPSVNQDLVSAFLDNTHLRVQVENGFFDMATPFFATEYTMDHLGLPADLRSRIGFEYYRSGHMIYLNEKELPTLKANVAGFIDEVMKP
jgi:carboxypeptidase C (cathepsin A)